ncbi:MAG: Putative glycosyl transferase [uncultured Blastococcus sp.]|uniref:Glycosyl transferase n=1 Tax=uncultured Blastococcus sp. TaxID=217144 RepID=A0A6J4J8A4_9ACTN|nr:MAG: Putative glycosyl transferase [uncultured Blastococcus sp.]
MSLLSADRFCWSCADPASRWQVAVCGTRARLHGDDAGAQFVRFVTVGVITSLVYFGLFLSLRGLGEQPANLAGAVVSSMLANELHRRLTFHAGERVSWVTAQWEGGGLAAVGLVATASALAALDDVVSDAWWAQVLLIASVTGAVGLGRFVSLRWWVFGPGPQRPAPEPV